MEILETREVRLSDLRLDPVFTKYADDPKVRQIADSIARVGMIHEPLVEHESMRPLCGKRQIAAHFLLERATIRVKLVALLTPKEFRIIQREEKVPIGRLPKTTSLAIQNELLSTYLHEKGSVAVQKASHPAVKEARQAIADKLGVSVEKVNVAAGLERKRKAGIKMKPPKTDEELLLHGILVDDWLLGDIRDARARVAKALRAAQATKQMVGGVRDARLQRSRWEAIEGGADELFQLLNGAQIMGLCAYCKGLEVLAKNCGFCGGSRYFYASQVLTVPAELLDATRRYVMVDGKMRNYDDYAPTRAAAATSGAE